MIFACPSKGCNRNIAKRILPKRFKSQSYHQAGMLQLPQLLGLKPILANCPDEEGLRPLHLAVLAGKVSLDLSKKELLHRCPLIGLIGLDKKRNFFIFVLSNKVSAVQSLVAAGADLGGTDKSGRSALHWAVACRQDGLMLR